MKKGETRKKIEVGVEEFILLAIIILNILDAFEFITSDLDYIKKIISWSALGLLLYNAKPSKIFVGTTKPFADKLFIFGYFAMILKNLISYAYTAIDGASPFLQPFYSFLIKNATAIEVTGLYIGLFLILAACLHISLRTKLRAPSLLHLLHADKQGKTMKIFLLHFFSLVFIALAFFIVFFNLVMEWLAIAIDAPLLMIALVVYFFFILRHKEHFTPGSFLSRFGDFGSHFYHNVLGHLRYKRTFLRVVAGMLILHLITDMFTFLWPYLLGVVDPLYFSFIGQHPTLYELLLPDMASHWLASLIHISNVFALILFMLVPVFMWFVLYYDIHIKVKIQFLAVSVFALFVMLLNPTFSISAIKHNLIFGVDILGVSAFTHQILPFEWVLLIALSVSLMFAHIHGRSILTVITIAGKLFFTMYAALYFYSVSSYYVSAIPLLFSVVPLLGVVFVLFFIITILFYCIGLYSFLIDTHEHLNQHLEISY